MQKLEALPKHYREVRSQTENLCAPLAIEDHVVQSMADVSPPKWHLAHTTWFFETFLLIPNHPKYKPFQSEFNQRFNSYYQQLGHPYPRDKRGLLSRPTLEEILEYRRYVDTQMDMFINEKISFDLRQLIMLGLHHEQQHQELLLMDIKHNLFMDPNFPQYMQNIAHSSIEKSNPLTFIEEAGGLVTIGHQGNDFCLDNELPVHQQFLLPYRMAARLITNEEFLEFIDSGGYQNPVYWLYEGWHAVESNQWSAPLYWVKHDNNWHIFTLAGLKPLSLHEPAMHVSYYEADAFAKWYGERLPLEGEWEHFVRNHEKSMDGNFLETNHYHPQPQTHTHQFYGDVWEWTASPYMPYPNYRPLEGAIGEYNGKFMCNQLVLKGGSFATPRSHIRTTYRNYFNPDKRWQFSGIRLVESEQS